MPPTARPRKKQAIYDRDPALVTESSSRKESTIPLFVVEHSHTPEACPASGKTGALLLDQISSTTAARYGVTIEAEAFLHDEHRLLLVVEAATREAVERFLAFLGHSGDLRVLPASTAERVVERGGCSPGTLSVRAGR